MDRRGRRRRADRRSFPGTVPTLADVMDRETLAWSLVFSLPPGIGIVGFAAFVIGRGVFDPVAVLAGATTTVVIFAIVGYGFSVGTADESREGPGPD